MKKTTRRRFICGGSAAFACGLITLNLYGPWRAQAAEQTTFEVTHSDSQWRKLLTPNQYDVLRQEGTERPYSSPLNTEHREGRFMCAGCELPLFSSKTKFESHTGWPSFWQPYDKAVLEIKDTSLGMRRTSVACRRCGGHLGHVFDDGPKPTGLRYCMNGVAMRFFAGTS